MSKIKIDRLEDVRAGDVVTLRDGEVTITGPARKYASSSTYFYVYSAATEISERTFVSAEREVPDLPMVPGLYIAGSMVDAPATANILRLNGDEWVGDGERLALDWIRGGDTLVRLVPEGSEAKKIAEYLCELAAMPHRSPYVTAVLKDAATDIERGDWNE